MHKIPARDVWWLIRKCAAALRPHLDEDAVSLDDEDVDECFRVSGDLWRRLNTEERRRGLDGARRLRICGLPLELDEAL